MSIITVSKQLGSSGTEIAEEIAAELHYEYVDKNIIGKALSEYGLPVYGEDEYDEETTAVWNSFTVYKGRFHKGVLFQTLQAVIYDYAKKGNAVIVGRGGQVFLINVPDALHVRIIAPFDIRVCRVMRHKMCDEKQAKRIVMNNDHDTSGFIKYLFDVNIDDQKLYDIVVNTQKLSVDTAARLIQDAIHSDELKTRERGMDEKLNNLALTQKVGVTLLYTKGIDIDHFSIEVEGGIVTLKGTVTSDKNWEECEKIVSNLEGVKRVKNNIRVVDFK